MTVITLDAGAPKKIGKRTGNLEIRGKVETIKTIALLRPT